jgi:hypothetical protein
VTDDDSTYRFDPSEFREDDESADGGSGRGPGTERDDGSPATGEAAAPDGTPRGADREFGWRGWTLVGMLFLALAVVPVLLYFVPRAQGLASSLGLGYRDAFLVLPLLPAVLLAALAVWATTRP